MNIHKKLAESFLNATKGKESFKFVMWFWGGFFYFLGFYIFDDINKSIKHPLLLNILMIFISCYFLWHIYATIKCAPKTKKDSKEEIKIEKLKSGGLLKAFARKLFLQESITKMNPRNILVILDLYFFLHFMSLLH